MSNTDKFMKFTGNKSFEKIKRLNEKKKLCKLEKNILEL